MTERAELIAELRQLTKNLEADRHERIQAQYLAQTPSVRAQTPEEAVAEENQTAVTFADKRGPRVALLFTAYVLENRRDSLTFNGWQGWTEAMGYDAHAANLRVHLGVVNAEEDAAAVALYDDLAV